MHREKYFVPKEPNKYAYIVIYVLTILGFIGLWGFIVYLINNPSALDNFLI